MTCRIILILVCLGGVLSISQTSSVAGEAVDLAKLKAEDAAQEFNALKTEIKYFTTEAPGWERLQKETLRQEALSRHAYEPCSLVIPRIRALIQALQSMPGGPKLEAEQKEFRALVNGVRPANLPEDAQRALFVKLCDLRRRIAIKNPLLNFDKILFIQVHGQARGDGHMVDQFFGFNALQGGGLYVLENAFSDTPRLANLLEQSTVGNGRLKGQKLDRGAFLSPELDFDGNTIAFAWTQAQHELPADADWSRQAWTKREAELMNHPFYYWSPERTFHVFKVNADGSNLTQLTDGSWNDYDPCFLPNGRIVFISERNGGNARCGGRWSATAVLHCMMPDGSDIVPLSYHETNEWQPSVNNDGMLVYTRWDYIDRASSGIHHLWTCYPDGRDPRSNHGNYPDWPWARPYLEMGIRAVPNSHKYVATSAAHHGHQFGSLVLIDPHIKDDRAMSQVKRITPEVPLAEAEVNPSIPRNIPDIGQFHRHDGIRLPDQSYATAWPLSEDFYLCSYSRSGGVRGLYLLDSFGNKVLLYRGDKIHCMDPIPFAPRNRPPVLTTGTRQMATDRAGPPETTATVSVLNVYKSEFPWPADTKIKALRVVNIFPKDTPHLGIPNIGGDQLLARGVLGTVPVEEDGSAHFKMPVGVEVYFQALDERGCAVQTMMSGAFVHSGEQLTCIGCHESKHESPFTPNKPPLAMQRPPAELAPEPAGSFPLTFPRLVQPVLDAKCIACHTKEPKAPNLSRELFPVNPKYSESGEGNYAMAAIRGMHRDINGWSHAFYFLRDKVWRKEAFDYQENRFLRDHQYSIPGEVGARASKLFRMLRDGHHDVKLSDEEWRRLIVWMDCNAPFYGAYHDTEKQANGGMVLPHLGLPADWQERIRAEAEKKQ